MNGARRGAWLLLAPAHVWLALVFGLPPLTVVVTSFWNAFGSNLVCGLRLLNSAIVVQSPVLAYSGPKPRSHGASSARGGR